MRTAAIFLALSCLFFSCEKNKQCPINASSIAGSYRIIAVTYQINSHSPEKNYYDYYFSEPCQIDDIFLFSSNGTYRCQDVGITCSPSGSYNGSWSVSGSTITIDGAPGNIELYDCSRIVISNSNVFSNGDKLRYVMERE